MIINCPNCKDHPYQDKTYGPKMRVHNPGKTGQRCTVCLDLKRGVVEVKTKKEK